jgi:hypothetical protein
MNNKAIIIIKKTIGGHSRKTSKVLTTVELPLPMVGPPIVHGKTLIIQSLLLNFRLFKFAPRLDNYSPPVPCDPGKRKFLPHSSP